MRMCERPISPKVEFSYRRAKLITMVASGEVGAVRFPGLNPAHFKRAGEE